MTPGVSNAIIFDAIGSKAGLGDWTPFAIIIGKPKGSIHKE